MLVLPSPLLGATAYEELVGALTEVGMPARTADTPASPEGPGPVIECWRRQVEPGDLLVPHSNAGFLAPHVGERASGTVFLDAALPPERGAYALAPTRFLEHLQTLVQEDGSLPPWTRWWPREDLEPMLPGESFDRVDAACPRMPPNYFQQQLAAPSGWAARPSAYLALGQTYADELGFARESGWPRRQVEGHHLEFVTRPCDVARVVLELGRSILR